MDGILSPLRFEDIAEDSLQFARSLTLQREFEGDSIGFLARDFH